MNHSDTETEILFSERQRFSQFWLWAVVLMINAFFIYAFVIQFFFEHQFGDKPMSNTGLLTAAVFTTLISLMFFILKLETIIKKDGIYYRFYPIQIRYKFISWDRVSSAFIRRYKPIIEYGGWGIRIGAFRSGKAMSIAKNMGVQIIYDNNKRLLIGTEKPEELQIVLTQMGFVNKNSL